MDSSSNNQNNRTIQLLRLGARPHGTDSGRRDQRSSRRGQWSPHCRHDFLRQMSLWYVPWQLQHATMCLLLSPGPLDTKFNSTCKEGKYNILLVFMDRDVHMNYGSDCISASKAILIYFSSLYSGGISSITPSLRISKASVFPDSTSSGLRWAGGDLTHV